MMRYLCLLFICIPVLCLANVYTWTDSQGNVHFSDKPQPGAKKIRENKAQTYNAQAGPHELENDQGYMPQQGSQNSISHDDTVIENHTEYTLVAISKPTQYENIHNDTLKIIVDVKPALINGDRIDLYMNGSKVAQTKGSNLFTIHNTDRGTHSLQVKIVNPKEIVVATSAETIVHIHRAHINRAAKKHAEKKLFKFSLRKKSKSTSNQNVIPTHG